MHHFRRPLIIFCSILLIFNDRNSSNGTFVNKVKVGKGNSLVIKNGDEITIIQERKDEPALSYIFKDLKKNQEESTVITDEGPFKDYEILESLGSGNFAVVKLGIQKKTGKKVAIKIIDKKKHLRQTSARKAQVTFRILRDDSKWILMRKWMFKGGFDG